MMNKFESFQKKCLKWTLFEEEKSYSREVYKSECKQVNIPPLSFRFNFNDMNSFHKSFIKPSQSIFPITFHSTVGIVVFAELT